MIGSVPENVVEQSLFSDLIYSLFIVSLGLHYAGVTDTYRSHDIINEHHVFD